MEEYSDVDLLNKSYDEEIKKLYHEIHMKKKGIADVQSKNNVEEFNKLEKVQKELHELKEFVYKTQLGEETHSNDSLNALNELMLKNGKSSEVEEVYCMKCFLVLDSNEGILLRKCLHTFCINCFFETLKENGLGKVFCPFKNDNMKCLTLLLQELEDDKKPNAMSDQITVLTKKIESLEKLLVSDQKVYHETDQCVLEEIRPFLLSINPENRDPFIQNREQCNFVLSVKIGDLIFTKKNGVGIVKFIKNIPEFGDGLYFGVEYKTRIHDKGEEDIFDSYFLCAPCSNLQSADEISPIPQTVDQFEFHALFKKRQTMMEAKEKANNYKFNMDTKLEFEINKNSQANISSRLNENKNNAYDRNRDMKETKNSVASVDSVMVYSKQLNPNAPGFNSSSKQMKSPKTSDKNIDKQNCRNSSETKSKQNYLEKNNYELPKNTSNTITYVPNYNTSNQSQEKTADAYDNYLDNHFFIPHKIPVQSKNQDNNEEFSVNDKRKQVNDKNKDNKTNYQPSMFESEQNKDVLQRHSYNTRYSSKQESEKGNQMSAENKKIANRNENKGALPKPSNSRFYDAHEKYSQEEKDQKILADENPPDVVENLPKEEFESNLNDFFSKDLGGFIIRCKKLDCDGGGFIEANEKCSLFVCPTCNSYNCRLCQAIHTGMSCDEYKNGGKSKSRLDENKISTFLWECNFCAQKNSTRTKKCKYCDQLKASQKPVKPEVVRTEICGPDEWICNSCKYKNITHKYTCQKCFELKENHELNFGKTVQNSKMREWKCEKCKFVNNTDSILCDYCGILNERRSHLLKIMEDLNSASKKEQMKLEQQRIQNSQSNISVKSNEVFQWICNYCTSVNTKQSYICEVCTTKTDEKLLKIAKTQEEVKSSNNKKQNTWNKTNNSNKNEQKNYVDPANTWECLFCTFVNVKGFNTCAGCQKRNDPTKKFTFKCLNSECVGFWAHDGNATRIKCPQCGIKNCLQCKAIHPSMNCEQYQKTADSVVKCPECGVALRYDKTVGKLICFHCEHNRNNGFLHKVKNYFQK